ncbi:hypothetical protein J2T02_004112 [Chitinophaga terrae (ex Kim and Jung 2007)]|jgi:hypothetical protein|uniref:hypothetical protein n=1 Tax=Chitinophaga terrae (ex Kim and Jung 2007) TaxID=408074 RepID=UPI0027874DB4|nr:hypothetical protein [Chitinophaga terrae (ex Kim and Jung 2007)]MDQ0108971.1 hypothetical protein [Chitinophaga terrae (ex Kim and Jung 2007)]
MKFVSVLIVSVFLMTACSKPAVRPEPIKSTLTIQKNDSTWAHEGVVANYNVDEDIVHVTTGKDNETLIISLKKGSIPFDGNVKDYSASVLVAPFKGSAAISAGYLLDSTKANKLRLLVIDNPEKRVACDFVLHFKKDDRYPNGEDTLMFKGRFDVRYKEFSLR